MIAFSRYIFVYILLSLSVLVPGVYSLVRFGLAPSIDFTGGTVMELATSSAVDKIALEAHVREDNDVNLESMSVANGIISYRFKPLDPVSVAKVLKKTKDVAADDIVVVRNETVGPVIGKELLKKALIAAALAICIILGYVAYAFKSVKYGVCAIVALVHDVLAVLGLFSLFGVWWGVEVDTLFVTAVLTTMSFSVHDTIVIFDRIREHMKKGRVGSIDQITDIALTETMNRSLTNSLTIIFMLLALILLGGETIRWFSIALLVGTISGTYSSPFVAVPALVIWEKKVHRAQHKVKST